MGRRNDPPDEWYLEQYRKEEAERQEYQRKLNELYEKIGYYRKDPPLATVIDTQPQPHRRRKLGWLQGEIIYTGDGKKE